jgi:hypothetical protein
MIRHFAVLSVVALAVLTAGSVLAAKPTVVSTEAEFQAALDAGATKIHLKKNGTIVLSAGLTHSGTDALEIKGFGATLDASGLGADAFVSDAGADVTFTDVTVRDGDERGIVIDVPSDATGTVTLTLKNVVVSGFKKFAVHVVDADESDASVEVDFTMVTFEDNGIQAEIETEFDDQDPCRVDETGDGDLVATLVQVVSEDNVYDGIELDERGDGDVVAKVTNSSFVRNGDSGSDDVEDAFDIDEAGDGSIYLDMTNVVLADCFDEGLDLDEEDAGSVYLTLSKVTAEDNVDENIKVTEEDAGDVVASLSSVTCSGSNESSGLLLEQEDGGDLDAKISGCTFSDNFEYGVAFVQEAPGTGTAKITGSKFSGNGLGDVDAGGVTVTRKP